MTRLIDVDGAVFGHLLVPAGQVHGQKLRFHVIYGPNSHDSSPPPLLAMIHRLFVSAD